MSCTRQFISVIGLCQHSNKVAIGINFILYPLLLFLYCGYPQLLSRHLFYLAAAIWLIVVNHYLLRLDYLRLYLARYGIVQLGDLVAVLFPAAVEYELVDKRVD